MKLDRSCFHRLLIKSFHSGCQAALFSYELEEIIDMIFHDYIYLDIYCEQRTEIRYIRNEVEVTYEYHTKLNGSISQVSKLLYLSSG